MGGRGLQTGGGEGGGGMGAKQQNIDICVMQRESTFILHFTGEELVPHTKGNMGGRGWKKRRETWEYVSCRGSRLSSAFATPNAPYSLLLLSPVSPEGTEPKKKVILGLHLQL